MGAWILPIGSIIQIVRWDTMATLQEWDTSYAPKGVELEDVTDDWYDEEGNLFP